MINIQDWTESEINAIEDGSDEERKLREYMRLTARLLAMLCEMEKGEDHDEN